MKIHWNGFLKKAVINFPKESCAFLFSKKPYSPKEEWYVFPIKNVSETPTDEWIPNKKEMLSVKAKAIRLGLVKIGNVHSHPYYEDLGEVEELIKPSDKDLSFARRFNDIIRIIVCVGKGMIYDTYIHDKFGNKIDIHLEGD